MVWWSVALAIFGILISAVLTERLPRKLPPGNSERYWLMGLSGLFPAWLVALLGLLGTGSIDNPTYAPPRAVISSSATVLIGVIVTDYIRRRLQARGVAMAPAIYWLLGLAAFVVPWLIALRNLR